MMLNSLKRLRSFSLVLLSVSCLTSLGQLPAVPQNVRGYRFPAEILLQWEPSEGAAYYRIDVAGLDRRWRPLATHVTETSFRDTGLFELAPLYQVAAVSASGEVATAPEIFVQGPPVPMRFWGVSVRMLDETSASFRWELDTLADALVEIRTGTDPFDTAGSSTDISYSHEIVVTGLQPGTEYFYRLTSVTPDGSGIKYVNRFTATFVPTPVVTLAVPSQAQSPGLVLNEDTPLRFDLVHDSLVAPLFTIVRQPLSGTVTGTSPSFEFLPNLERTTSDIFEYVVTDGSYSENGQIWVWVNPVNDSPVAYDQSVFVLEDDVAFRFFVEARDSDFDQLTYAMVNEPLHGTISRGFLPNEFIYTPTPNFNGADRITFLANDGQADGNVAMVRIGVYPQNDPPVALDITRDTYERQTVLIELPRRDIDGDFLNYVITQPAHGSAAIWNTADPVRLLYTANAGFIGTDVFYYSVTDGSLGASAQVTINVKPRNNPPVAIPQTVVTEYEVPVTIQLMGSDPDGDALTYSIETTPGNGTLSDRGQIVTYTPNPGFSGTDSFTFTVADQFFASVSEPAQVTITVASANAPPFAPSDLTALPLSRKRIQLTWTDHSMREQGFAIERADDNTGFKQIAQVGANALTYTDGGLNPSRTYSYRVRAFNNGGASEASNVASAVPVK